MKEAREAGLDISQKHYENASETLREVTEQMTGLSLPSETRDAWKVVLRAVRVIDDRLDAITDEEERKRFTSDLRSFLHEGTVDFSKDKRLADALARIRDLLNDLSRVQKQSFIESISRVLNVTEKIKTEEDPSKFVTLTRLEGQVFSRIFLSFLPEDYRKSEQYSRLIKVLTRLGRAANSFDTFVDLKEDYLKGRSQVKPTAVNRLLLFGAAVADGASFLRESGFSKDLISHFAKRIKETMLKSSE